MDNGGCSSSIPGCANFYCYFGGMLSDLGNISTKGRLQVYSFRSVKVRAFDGYGGCPCSVPGHVNFYFTSVAC